MPKLETRERSREICPHDVFKLESLRSVGVMFEHIIPAIKILGLELNTVPFSRLSYG